MGGKRLLSLRVAPAFYNAGPRRTGSPCRPKSSSAARGAQPQEHRRHDPAQQARRDHGRVGVGEVVAGLRHDLRRGAAALRRVALGVRAAVPRADGEARRRVDRGALARRSRSSRRRRRGTRARPSGPSRRSTTTSACSSRAIGKSPLPELRATQIASADGPADGRRGPGASGGDEDPAPRARSSAAGRGVQEADAGEAARRRVSFARVVDGEVDRPRRRHSTSTSRRSTRSTIVDRPHRGKDGSPSAARRLASRPRSTSAEGLVVVDVDGKETLFSQSFACVDCGISIGELTPRMFSFNSPVRRLPGCDGLGVRKTSTSDRILRDPSKSIEGGAIAWGDGTPIGSSQSSLFRPYKVSPKTPSRSFRRRSRRCSGTARGSGVHASSGRGGAARTSEA